MLHGHDLGMKTDENKKVQMTLDLINESKAY